MDSHSIFRFVQGRDSPWRKHYLLTDDIETQCGKVLRDCKVEPKYALSPQVKGKMEYPYRLLQDRIVRTCARERIETVQGAGEVLKYELDRYNNHQVHSTTKEIPILRFERAIKEKRSLFREFKLPSPYTSVKDIFCLRVKRKVDAYHKISINNLKLKVHKAPLREGIGLGIAHDEKTKA